MIGQTTLAEVYLEVMRARVASVTAGELLLRLRDDAMKRAEQSSLPGTERDRAERLLAHATATIRSLDGERDWQRKVQTEDQCRVRYASLQQVIVVAEERIPVAMHCYARVISFEANWRVIIEAPAMACVWMIPDGSDQCGELWSFKVADETFESFDDAILRAVRAHISTDDFDLPF